MGVRHFIGAMVLFCGSNAFNLLDVGASRTGTQSMYHAMKILGLNPVHSGYHPEVRPALCEYLFRNGSLDQALGVLDGFDAAMDEPFMLIYEEIMAAFPEAKFLLTISDAEKWFKSQRDLGLIIDRTASAAETTFYESLPDKCKSMKSWGCTFENSTAEEKNTCLQNYHRHIERVQKIIPADRLLVYNWSDGWAPLAHFLGTTIPDEEFPHDDWMKEHYAARAPVAS